MAKYLFDEIAFNSKEKKKPEDSDRNNYIGLEHLVPGSFEIPEYGSDITPTGEKLIMRKGDVLFGKRRAYQRKVAISPCDGIFSAHGMVLRPKTDVIDSDFFPWFIFSDQFMERAVQISVGGLSPTINWSDLKKQEFELPSLETQKELAHKLWEAYRLKEAYKRLLSATRELVKSQFIEMFGTEQFHNQLLEDCCSYFMDGDWIESKDQSDSGIRLIQTGNVGDGFFKGKEDKSRYINEETFKRLSCTEIFEGDILISRLPEPIGRACVIPASEERMITAVDCTIVRLKDNLLPEYFINLTKSPIYQSYIKKNTTGTTRSRISRGNLGKFPVPIPPKELQKQFATFAAQADKSEYYQLTA